MKFKAVITGAVLVLSAAVRAEDPNAILDLLERKGIITAEEAAQARTYYEKQQAAAVAKSDKPRFGEWLEQVGFTADARLRYEWRSGEDQLTGDNRDRDRFRFRVRLGLEGVYREHYLYGVRVETSSNPRSSNVTFGDGADKNGPFAKNNNTIALGRLYIGWKPDEHVTLIAGRQEVPFVNTTMVWDDDLNPEGAVEKFSFKTDKLDLFANFGQFIYADFNENNFGAGGKSDVWMFGWQAGARAKFTKDVSLTVAPTLYHYVNENNFSATAFNGGPVGVGTNNAAINDLVVVDVPVELAFMLGAVPAKLFGDFAVNVKGSDRADAAGDSAHDDQIYAYQAGVAFGSAKKKGDWMLKAFWQHSELYSLDPNLVDSDLFDSRLNLEGFCVQGSYYFTDFLFGKVTYGYATDIKKDLPTLSGAGDIGNSLHRYQLLQADLNWKF